MPKHLSIVLLLYGINWMSAHSQTGDETRHLAQASTSAADSVHTKPSILQKIINYFDDTNKEKEEKAFDISFIGGPSYSSSSKLGLGVMASGLYRVKGTDKEMSPSNLALFGQVTSVGSYQLGVRGNTLFPKEKYRIDLDSYFSSENSRYWGVGYHRATTQDYTEYTTNESTIRIDFLIQLKKNLYLGLKGDFSHITAKKMDDWSYLDGESKSSTYGGTGLSLSYDSRDFIPNAYEGIYAYAAYTLFPKAIGNKNTISKTQLIFRNYQRVWEGGILAFDLQGIFSGGDTHWSRMVLTGNSREMRGYFEGKYRDRMYAQSQMELRQHVWRRNGVVLWVGAGNVFPSFKDFSISHTLPTYGIGYRWEFKKRINVRLDYGIGKGETSFYANINESF